MLCWVWIVDAHEPVCRIENHTIANTFIIHIPGIDDISVRHGLWLTDSLSFSLLFSLFSLSPPLSLYAFHLYQ